MFLRFLFTFFVGIWYRYMYDWYAYMALCIGIMYVVGGIVTDVGCNNGELIEHRSYSSCVGQMQFLIIGGG